MFKLKKYLLLPILTVLHFSLDLSSVSSAADLSCTRSLIETTNTTTDASLPADQVLRELVNLRDSIEQARHGGHHAVAYTLAKSFRNKIAQALNLGVPLEKLRELRLQLDQTNHEEQINQRKRQQDLLANEKNMSQWVKVPGFPNAKDVNIVFTNPAKPAYIQALNDGTVQFLDLNGRTAHVAFSFNSYKVLLKAAFSQDGTRVLLIYANGYLEVRDTRSGAALFVFRSIGSTPDCYAFRQDGSKSLFVEAGGRAGLYDVNTREKLLTFDPPEKDSFYGVEFSPDGSRIAVTSIRGNIFIFNSVSGERLAAVPDAMASFAKFTPDGKFLVARSRSGNEYRVFKSSDGAFVGEINSRDDVPGVTGYPVNSMKFSEDGKRILTTLNSANGAVVEWDVQSLKAVQVWSGHQSQVNDANYIPGTSQIVTAVLDNSLIIADTITAEKVQKLNFAGYNSLPLSQGPTSAVSADGSMLISVSREHGATFWLRASPELE